MVSSVNRLKPLQLQPRHKIFGWLNRRPPRRLQQRAKWYYGRQESRRWWRWLWLLIMLTTIVLIWLLFFSSVFKITDIKITGLYRLNNNDLQQVVNTQIKSRWWGILPKDHYFSLPKNSLKRQLAVNPAVQSVAIERHLPNIVIIKIKERTANVVWKNNSQWAELDLDGQAINYLSTTTAVDLPVLIDITNKTINLGQVITTREVIKLAIETWQGLSGVKFVNFTIDNQPQQLTANTNQGYFVRLNALQPLDAQNQALAGVFKALTPDERQKLEYVDVRVPNLPTYKLK